MRMQMYMYYYTMYGLNPMYSGYMNPYGSFGQMPGKPASGPSSMPPPPMGMGMPMGPMGPMGPMPSLGGVNSLMNPGGFNTKMPPNKID